MKPAFQHSRVVVAALALAASGLTGSATDSTVSAEATIQGGAVANLDIDEVTAGYVHVKYYATPDSSRKAYFQFNLAGHTPDTHAPATFTVKFTVGNKQRVRLWALNQAYPGFNSGVTWNTAQANDTASNGLLTTGPVTAAAIGTDVLIPASGTTPYTFTIPRLGDVLISNRVTLVLSGVSDGANNAGGLRMQRTNAILGFGLPRYEVYLAAGQSNMDGRGSTSELTGDLASWSQPQTDVRVWYANPVNLDPLNPTYNTGWQVLTPGFSVPPGFSGTLPSARFGPELTFARAVADASTHRRVALIKVSQGGTSLSSDWKPTSGYMYATLTNIARVALQSLTNSGAQYTLRGMIWHQGESDGSLSTATYQARLTDFIAAVRNDFGVANLPFVVGELATNRSLTVRQAQLNVSETVPYVGFASSSNLVTLAPDDPHFTSEGALIMGQRMAAALEFPPVRLTAVHHSGSNVTLVASGLARASCRLLTATNLALPLAQWGTVATNTFDGSGRLTFTEAVPSDAALRYYAIASF